MQHFVRRAAESVSIPLDKDRLHRSIIRMWFRLACTGAQQKAVNTVDAKCISEVALALKSPLNATYPYLDGTNETRDFDCVSRQIASRHRDQSIFKLVSEIDPVFAVSSAVEH